MSGIDRRDFLKASAAAGALVLAFDLPMKTAGAARLAQPLKIGAWLVVAPEGTITVLLSHCEMGQGVATSLPMLVAEELEADWKKVRFAFAPADPVYDNTMFGMQATGGSTSVRESFDPLRRAGAQAREMLKAAAAKRWKVSPEECQAREGRIHHAKSGKSLGYGELAAEAAGLSVPVPALKPAGQWKLIGKPVKRLDIPDKVNGKAVYGIDVKVENMLIGAIQHCPVLGGKLKAVDEAPALTVSGVEDVVPLDDAVVVLADNYWAASQGLAALQPIWDEGANALLDSAQISKDLVAATQAPAKLAMEVGDAGTALAQSARQVRATYEAPFLAHACMEPMNATARVTDKGVELWLPTQSPGPTRLKVAAHLGIKPELVTINTTFLGGGFGRRFETDFVIKAVEASRHAKRPVKLIWSREEDIRHDFYRPAAAVHFSGGLSKDGALEALTARIASPSILARAFPSQAKDGIDHTSIEGIADSVYAIPVRRIEYAMVETGVPVGFWRSVGHSQNAFFLESFIDELALAAGKDPVAFRLSLLGGQARHRTLLEAVAKAAGMDKPAPFGRHRGIAIHQSFGSISAQAVELSVLGKSRIVLHRVTAGLDCGTVVNPDTVKAQVESAIVYGMAAAVYGAITVQGGAVEQGNFDDYPMPRLGQMPKIDVILVEGGPPMGGVGEPATPPIGPALANALFTATGRRIRSLPLARHGYLLG